MSEKVGDHEGENLDPVVSRNLRILERALIPNTGPLTDPVEEERSKYVSRGEGRFEGENTTIYAVSIRYNTRTGEIVKTPHYKDPSIKYGDYSVLRTYIVGEGEETTYNSALKRWDITPGKYKLLLAYPKDWLTPHAAGAAVEKRFVGGSGVDELASQGQWILPERIDPELIRVHGQNIMGTLEPWGESKVIKNPADKKISLAIEVFNKKHGPSLEEQLFRNTIITLPKDRSPRGVLDFFARMKEKFNLRKH